MRPYEPNSIRENKYGTTSFYNLFNKIIETDFPVNTILLGGVRSEESPRRHVAMTQDSTYKYITWGKKLNPSKGQYTFYPIYDWSYTDIWKAIHDNKWIYTKVYDYQYMYGVSIRAMRVSNLHHETAIETLFYLQEIERDTWTALTKRMSGIDTAGKLSKDDYFVKELPFMFRSWEEYRDYLTQNLVKNDKLREKFEKKWKLYDERYKDMLLKERLIKAEINTILANDIDLNKLRNFTETPEMEDFRRWSRGEKVKYTRIKNKYIPYDI
jgi:predicted phosphoadenosine phosphosulfate sulfurtransferase